MSPDYNSNIQGAVEGTPIQSLYQRKLVSSKDKGSNVYYTHPTDNYNPNYHDRYKSNHNSNHNHNNNHNQYPARRISSPDDTDYIVNDPQQSADDDHIDIDKNNNDNDNDNHNEDNEDFDDEIIRYKKSSKSRKKKIKKYGFMMYIKEILLLLIIYTILSQDFIRKFVGEYINLTLPNSEGSVSIYGKIIYGFIMCIIFLIARYFFVYRF
jgi:hypothetical protein